MDRRPPAIVFALGLLLALAGCSATPTPISVETNASEAVSAARYVAYWMDVDLSNVRNPDAALATEMSRLKAAGARLSAQAESLEQELEAATVARMEKKSTDFTQRGPLQTRLLREQTLQVRTQWEKFLRDVAAADALERPATPAASGGAATGGDGIPSGSGEPARPGRSEMR